MDNRLQWYRLVLSTNGKVDSCEPVDDGGVSSLTVVYVQARTEREASRKAYNLHAKLLLRARRKRYRSEGKCRCGSERDDPSLVRCSRCRDRQKLYHQRAEAKARGESVPPLSKRETRVARRTSEDASLEQSVLLEVEAAAEACRTMGEFRSWLRKRLANADRKARAA